MPDESTRADSLRGAPAAYLGKTALHHPGPESNAGGMNAAGQLFPGSRFADTLHQQGARRSTSKW